MLWLCLHLPLLPLEVFLRGVELPHRLVVTVNRASREFVYACEKQLQSAGIFSGMSVSAALALVSDLCIRPRNEVAENRALACLAGWCSQYSSFVSIRSPNNVLLEIGASLKLFEGLEGLLGDLRSRLYGLGYTVYFGIAPTPIAAQLLACTNGTAVLHRSTLQSALADIPLAYLDLNPSIRDSLHRIGVETFGECSCLPRGDLAQRFGPDLLAYFDRALGKKADPLPRYKPPPYFAAQIPLPAAVTHAEALLFTLRRLVLELCGFLRGSGGAVRLVRIEFVHRKPPITRLSLELVSASRDADHLLQLVKERLQRVQLASPVLEVGLRADNICSLAPYTPDLFSQNQTLDGTTERLVDRLRVRLGETSVGGLALNSEHRPEYAWKHCAPGKTEGASGETEAGQKDSSQSRPLWLLVDPLPLKVDKEQPCFEGALTLLHGPERVETGWWDGKDVARDYFIARNPQGAKFWIFRERHKGRKWFLHGIFA